MPTLKQDSNRLYFRQSSLPRMFFVALGQLGVYVHLTGSKLYPYAVEMTEAEFKSCVELAREL